MSTAFSADDLRRRIQIVLKELGVATIGKDPDGDLFFYYDNVEALVCFDAADPAFVSLTHRNGLLLRSPSAARLAWTDECILRANARCKVAKIIRRMVPEALGTYRIRAAVEFIVEDLDRVTPYLMGRHLLLLHQARDLFKRFFYGDEFFAPIEEARLSRH